MPDALPPSASHLRPAADWQQLQRVALLGTRQSTEALPTVPGFAAPADSADHREQQVLLLVGVLSTVRKAGFRPPLARAEAPETSLSAPATASSEAPTAAASEALPAITDSETPHRPAAAVVAGPETAAPLGPQGAQLLQLMLEGTEAGSLYGFLEDMHRHQRRVPPRLLVALLEATRTRRELHGPASQVLGRRGEWLAAQNPAWQPVLLAGASAPDPATWEAGTLAERRSYLYLLRDTDPTQARTLLATTLPQEPARTQAELLQTLAHNPSPADAPLLEQYLTAKSKEVRQAVRPLLARLPDSPLLARLWQRAELLVRLKTGLLSKKLLVELPPADWDKTWLPDGIEQKDNRFQGERTALLGQMLALLPPQRWAAHWQLAPRKLLELAAATEWAGLLLTAWAEAAVLHQDAEWAGALLAWFYEKPRPHPAALPTGGLVSQLTPEQAADLLLPLINATPHFSAEVGWLPLLQLAPGPWPERLTRRVVEVLRDTLSKPVELYRIQYAAGQLLEHMARAVPAAQYRLCAEPLQPLLQDVPYLHNSLARLLNTLHFRQQLAEVLLE
ncbi:DUF5691 domain-containing protein [Hymenobacter sp. APR13]|uniref:DUF5691 domain-containing protein n=1 Tax=Hymenobacter sp. APR13 TaxID=1356852 RepID=UPI0004E03B8C|nr:DUF5691 domain-containing protein [Hymenobacter sp. APR13]AII53716.1 hypothetical protein N008_17255 [Hymenobacter sp. APR13]